MIVVLMPSFGSCPVRRENERHVLAWYESRGIPVVRGRDHAPGMRSRARAINDAARAVAREHPERHVWIIADNDLIPDEPSLQQALTALDRHAAVTPHDRTLLTDPAGRQAILHGRLAIPADTIRKGSRSFVVLHRRSFERTNGLDERFIGWGPEDRAFLFSLQKQAGSVLELDGARVHLWHPVDVTKLDRVNLRRNRARMRAYQSATPEQARALSRKYGRWDEPRDRPTERPGPPHNPRERGDPSVVAGRHAARPDP